jgi:folylpolyglutamate synthase/dihydropteroate synthase
VVAAAATDLGISAESIPSVDDAVARARSVASPDDLILVTGSLYVVGPARAALAREDDA